MYPSPQVHPDQLVGTDRDFRGRKPSESSEITVISTTETITEHTVKYHETAREHRSKGASEKVAATRQPDKHVADTRARQTSKLLKKPRSDKPRNTQLGE